MEAERFDQWCILELMEHRRLAGKVTEAAILGGALLRIDVPGSVDGPRPPVTQFYGPAAIYCLTPTTEEIARAVAEQSEPAPVSRWEFPQLAITQKKQRICRSCGIEDDGEPDITFTKEDLCSTCAALEAEIGDDKP